MNIAGLKELNNFTGTEHYYKGIWASFVYTDGVKFLCENADAYWLLGMIASSQMIPDIYNDEQLKQMQFWTLKKGVPPNSAVLICERDSNDVAHTFPIDFTDFPFETFPNGECRIWVAPTSLDGKKTVKVAYLPSEH